MPHHQKVSCCSALTPSIRAPASSQPANAKTVVADAAKAMTAHDFSGPIHGAQDSGVDTSWNVYSMYSGKGWEKQYESRNSWVRSFNEQECFTW